MPRLSKLLPKYRKQLKGLASSIESLVRQSNRLHLGVIADRDLAIGASRIGGRPDVPEGFAWPASLSFIAQIDLSMLPEPGGLPKAGWLLFFYDAVEQPWGFELSDRGGSAVIYVPPGSQLRRVDCPVKSAPGERDWDDATSLSPCSLAASSEDTLPYFIPDPDGGWMPHSNLRRELASELPALQWVLGEPELHRLLGWSDPVQGDMEEELQELFPGTSDWRLLLQVDSHLDHRWVQDPQWGSGGRIYFWIQREDLDAGRFDRTWTILQCA